MLVFPEQILLFTSNKGLMPPNQQALLCTLASECGRVLEMGTYEGFTAINLARFVQPGGEVFTIDNAPEAIRHEAIMPCAAAYKRLFFVVGDAGTGDYRWMGPMDMILVDAGHDKVSATASTRKALSLLARDGVVLWHDWQTLMPTKARYSHVVEAVESFNLPVWSNCDFGVYSPTMDRWIPIIRRFCGATGYYGFSPYEKA